MTDKTIHNHVKIGLAAGIEREISDLVHSICAHGNIHMDTALNHAMIRYRMIRKMAGQLSHFIEEEERHANEVAAAQESDVRSRQREIDFGDTQESWQRVRQQ